MKALHTWNTLNQKQLYFRTNFS